MSDELNQLAKYMQNEDPLKKSKKKDGKSTPKQINSKKKSEISNREILALTGGFFPIHPVTTVASSGANNKDGEKKKPTQWVNVPIYFKENEPSSITHWIPKEEAEKIYAYNKFRIPVDMVVFTDDEYEKYLKSLDTTWTKEETQYLWELCQRFDLRFIVIADRYDEKYNRTIEDLKERYFSIAKRMLEARGERTHPVATFVYNKEFERKRKFHFEKFLHRPKEKNEEERVLLEEIRKLDHIIKKEEKEHQNLEKVMKFCQKDDQLFGEEDNIDGYKEGVPGSGKKEIKTTKKLVYLRGQVMHAPLPLSQRMNDKVNMILTELAIPVKPMPTVEIEKLYDELRQNILAMFSLQKHLKKREQEKKELEEKAVKVEVPPAGSNPRPLEDTADKRKAPYELAEKTSAQKKQKLG